MGVEGIPIPYGEPNAQAHIERLIGTIRRQCLDHFLLWKERHLCKVLTEFFRWYHTARVHQGLGAIPEPDSELEAPVPTNSKVVAIRILNGLHHDYRRAA
jgi:transposase InsO family protein